MLKNLMPHICIVLSLILMTFFVLDQFNPGMNFLGNDTFKVLLMLDGVAVIVASAYLIAFNRRQ